MVQNSSREPSADLRAAAGQLHELFTALTNQGFTEAQALVTLGQVLANQQGKG